MTIQSSSVQKLHRDSVFNAAVNLMLLTIPIETFKEKFQVDILEKETIFDSLIRSGKVDNLFDAAALIGKAFPPIGKYSWNDLAKWIAEYDFQYENIRISK